MVPSTLLKAIIFVIIMLLLLLLNGLARECIFKSFFKHGYHVQKNLIPWPCYTKENMEDPEYSRSPVTVPTGFHLLPLTQQQIKTIAEILKLTFLKEAKNHSKFFKSVYGSHQRNPNGHILENIIISTNGIY